MTANKATPEELVQALRDEAKWYTGTFGSDADWAPEYKETRGLLIAAADLIESLQNQPVDTTVLPITAPCESPRAEFEVWCDDEMMAGAGGPRDTALREALNYAFQYMSEGKVTLYEVTRTKIALSELTSDVPDA